MKKIGIYKITNPKGKVYIGQSINTKEREGYYRRLAIRNQPKIYNSIKKYGWGNHKFEVIEECTLNCLSKREIFWKKYYLELKDWNLGEVLFCELYDGGGGPRSQETKDKIRSGNLGKKYTQETKDKISQNSKGISRNKGRVLGPRPQEIKDKIQRGRFKPILQFDLEGNFIKEWGSIQESKLQIKGDIDSALSGRQKTSGGFIWKYKN